MLSELLFVFVFLLWQVTEHPMHFETVIIIPRKFWMRNVKMKVCTYIACFMHNGIAQFLNKSQRQ